MTKMMKTTTKKTKLVLLIAVPVMVVVILQQFWLPSLNFNRLWRTVSQHGILHFFLSLCLFPEKISVCFLRKFLFICFFQ